ncbi:MAG: PhoH family protein [Planctomycetes bacterium]|nr:PhoH family protein [Planctomycetota bacterium]MCB9903688.1 PhoH family protein [Planctomycetota bacterium]
MLGPYDRYAKLLRQSLDIELFTRNGNLRIKGQVEDVQVARARIEHLLGKSRKGRELAVREIEEILLGKPKEETPSTNGPAPIRRGDERPDAARGGPRSLGGGPRVLGGGYGGGPPVRTGHIKARPVQPRSENQRIYLELIEKKDLVFGLGVAGTGKTYLAVAAAVRALRGGECRRLVITRPVVEAGERLGFLPGDVQAKLNPYMRPIYDALNEMIGFEDVMRLEETGVIEVAPLAFMRGRTLSNAFVILDEGQNTTVGQMKMFLTRLGEGSRMVVTGDPTQNDLPDRERSGLVDVVARLRGYQEVGFMDFTGKDIVRHPLVEKIVRAYEAPPKLSPKPARKGEREGERETDREPDREGGAR